MSVEQLIADYGYLTILIGTFLEGETIVILAGMAVASGIGNLQLPWVILCALTGSFTGDQFYYYVGRHWGPKVITKRPSWQQAAQKVYTHLHRHQYWLILTFRFYYGLRNVTPFVVGAARIPRLRFFTLNLIGAIIWAVAFTYGGLFLGETLRSVIADYHRYALYIIGMLVALGFAIWLTRLIYQYRRAKRRGLK